NREAVLDLETRAVELAYPRGHVDHVAKPDGGDEIGARVDQGNADDAEGAGKLTRLHAKGGLEQLPGVGVEDLEEAAVEHDPGRIALAPFDGHLPAVGERRQAGCLRSCSRRYSRRALICHACPPPSTARPRESGDPGQMFRASTSSPGFPLTRE